MAQSPISQCLALTTQTEDKKQNQKIYEHYEEYVLNLPVMDAGGRSFYRYRSLYAPSELMVGVMVARQLFQAKSSDIILVTLPKSGTTWLKALTFATVNRKSSSYNPSEYLTSLSAHDCVPYLEMHVYSENQVPNLNLMPDPRIFSTHATFDMLPDSIIQSGCKIIYLCRDMKDIFISWWHFFNKVNVKTGIDIVPLEQALDQFCNGICYPGSFWDHELDYWKASQEKSNQVIFMTYENFMGDTASSLRKMAEFIGYPFTVEENKKNVVDEIVAMCAFENLSNLDVNKTGSTKIVGIDNSILFRRGKVGDWVNYLTPEMAKRLDNLTLSKFKGTGLLN